MLSPCFIGGFYKLGINKALVMQSNNLSLDELKNSILEDLKSRVDDKILEQANFDLLSKLIKNAENKEEAIAIAELGTTYKRTGFHFDKKLEKIGSTIKYFKKNNELSFCQNEQSKTHKLIIGDNYDALLNLSISYKSKIDVIYIDPPYGKDDMGKFADTNYNNSITRDNLLSMLYPRLVLAKQLLSEEGVIFCSIDDKNQAYVKCLFDDVFGEQNFIANICKKGVGGRQDSKFFASVHEYVLCFCRQKDKFQVGREAKQLSGYNLIWGNRKYRTQLLRKWGNNSRREERPNLYYPIYYSPCFNSFSITPNNYADSVEIYPITPEGDGRWRWGKKTMEKAFLSEKVEIKNVDGQYIPYERLFEDEASISKPFSTWLDDIKNDGIEQIKQIFSDKVFDYPKAVDLCKRLIRMSGKNDGVILDFFAGSGTTGQAVLELNKEDGGNRTFILCTNNEKTDMNPNGIAYDVTSKRLKRVMTGSCYDGTNDFEWIKKNSPLGDNLDVYEIADVSNSEQSEGKSAFDVIDEKLYGEVKMIHEDKIKWVRENFSVTQKYLEDRI